MVSGAHNPRNGAFVEPTGEIGVVVGETHRRTVQAQQARAEGGVAARGGLDPTWAFLVREVLDDLEGSTLGHLFAHRPQDPAGDLPNPVAHRCNQQQQDDGNFPHGKVAKPVPKGVPAVDA